MDYNLCLSKKIAYDSISEVEEALIYSQIHFNNGATNFYQCSLCQCYHLTSSSEINPLLKSGEVVKRIEKERKAIQLGHNSGI